MAVSFAFGLTMLLLVGSIAGQFVLALAVFLAQALLTLGSIQYARTRGALSAGVLSCLAGLGASVTVFVVLDHDTAGSLAGVLGLTLIAATAVQLTRGERVNATAWLAWTMSLSVLSVLLVAWVALRGAHHGTVSTALALAGVAVATFAESRFGRGAGTRTIAVIAAGAMGAAVSPVAAISEAAPPLAAVSMCAFGALMAVAGSGIVDRIEAEHDAGATELVEAAAGTRAAGRRRRTAGRETAGGPAAVADGRSWSAGGPASVAEGRSRPGSLSVEEDQPEGEPLSVPRERSRHRKAARGGEPTVVSEEVRPGRRSRGRGPVAASGAPGAAEAVGRDSARDAAAPPGRRSSGGGRRRKRHRRSGLAGSTAYDTLRWTMPLVAAAPVSYVLGRMLIG